MQKKLDPFETSSDIVLDPFCGCGTTIAAAQKLNRGWIGIDVTHLAIGLMKLRLLGSFGMVPVGARRSGDTPVPIAGPSGETDVERRSDVHGDKSVPAPYQVIGQPEDLDGAKELAENDRYGFQWWILPMIGAKAYGSEVGQRIGKKGADRGIDGELVFVDDNSGKAKRVIVSVKSGHVNSAQIRDLGHVIDREQAAIGVFLTLEGPSKPMLQEAAEKGFYTSPGWNRDYPRLRILTVEDLLAGKTVDLPPNLQTFKQAGKIASEKKDQGSLEF